MSKPQKIVAEKLIGSKKPSYTTTFSEKDTILYALGIGFSMDPLREEDFMYTYELNDNFTVFPTYAVVSNQFDIISQLMESQFMPKFSPFVILHAEQKLVMIKPKIQPGAEYIHEQEIIDVADKGKNALILFRINSYVQGENGSKELAFQNYMTMFFRGLGGFGFKGKGLFPMIPQIPERKPDHVVQAVTFPGQAFIYRLSGDINPLHVDPNIAATQKFQKPIIHGLASYGVVARAIVQNILSNDPTQLKSYHTRFVGHVFPGQTLIISIWKVNNSLIFEALVKQRNTKSMIGIAGLQIDSKL